MRFLGTHLLLDMWGATPLDDPIYIEEALKQCAAACGATVLKIDMHHFGEREGVTGVAMLAESHISVHSWPEHAYAAFDIFVCGRLDPYPAIDMLLNSFSPSRTNLVEQRRGLCPASILLANR